MQTLICKPFYGDSEIYLLPQRGLASQTFIDVLRRFCSRNFDDFSKQLRLVHIVDGFFGVLCILKLNVTKSSVGLPRVISTLRFATGISFTGVAMAGFVNSRDRDICNLAEG